MGYVFDSGTISAVVAVAGLALTFVALFASWRVSKRGVSVQVYRDTAQAWENRSKSQDTQIADMASKLAARETVIAELQGQVGVLRDAVTGRASWETLERRTAEMLALAGEIRTETRSTAAQVRALAEQIAGGGA